VTTTSGTCACRGTSSPTRSRTCSTSGTASWRPTRTASANYDQAWLDYQWEIARRHHRTAKNRTDGVASVDNIDLRYVIALAYPITATLRPFLEKGGHSAEEVEKMHDAWRKSVLLQITLWAQPYVRDGDY
jgi:hypothetical protein